MTLRFWHRKDRTTASMALGYQSPESAIRALYQAGWSAAQIADHFSVTPAAIVYDLHRLGVTLRPRGGHNNPFGPAGKKGAARMIQPYECDLCGHIGRISLPRDCSVLYAINTIKLDHAARSPHCTFSVETIQIHPPEPEEGNTHQEGDAHPEGGTTHD